MRILSMHGHGPRRASARSTARIVAVLLVALCALMLGSPDAHALTYWNDDAAEGTKEAVVLPYEYPDGRPYALAEFLEFNWDSFSTQTKNDILASNGAFKRLLENNVKNYRYENGGDHQDNNNMVSAILQAVVKNVSKIWGNDYIWYISCTQNDYVEAKKNIDQFLYPSEGIIGSNNNINIPFVETNVYGGRLFIGTNNSVNVEACPVRFNITSNSYLYEQIRDNKAQYPYIYCYVVTFNNGGTPTCASNLFMTKNKCTFTIDDNNNGIFHEYSTGAGGYIQLWNFGFIARDGEGLLYMDSSPTNRAVGSSDFNRNRNYNTSAVHGYSYISDGVDINQYFPTLDPVPTAPTISIGDVTIDLSNGPYTSNNITYTTVNEGDNNWSVHVTSNTTNNYGGDVVATDPTDYTSILNAILAAINSLRSEMTTYTNQITSAVNDNTNNIQTAIKNLDTNIGGKITTLNSQLHSDIQTLGTNIVNNINGRWDSFASDLWQNLAALDGDLIEEMDAVARYLSSYMDFDSGFSDSNIISWLKKIYARLGGKKTTVPAPDEDPRGWLDRLTEILNALLDAVISGLNVAQLVTLFDGLKARFPISIPWDIAAIVNMFAGGAVTPVFDLPLPDGINGSYTTVHVDLHEWDEEMALVRQGELILFGIVLMYNTKWMFDTVTMTYKRGD